MTVLIFFVEQTFMHEPITKITKYSPSNTLSDIINHFEPYYLDYKFFNSFRYHYIDVRSFKLGKKGTIYLFSNANPMIAKLLTNHGYSTDEFNLIKHVNDLENIILYMMVLNNESESFLDLMNTISILTVNKSIFHHTLNKKVYSPYLYMNADDFLLYMSIYRPLVHKRQLKFGSDIDRFNTIFFNLINDRCKFLLLNVNIFALTPLRTFGLIQEICNITIHYYTMLRMFGYYYKDYNQCSNYNKNIIMYCGHNHNLFYTHMIANYYNKHPDISIINHHDAGRRIADQCIRLNSSFDYFD